MLLVVLEIKAHSSTRMQPCSYSPKQGADTPESQEQKARKQNVKISVSSSDEALTTPSDPKSGQAQILKGGGCSQECESNTANNCVMAILRKFSVRWATPYTSSGQLRRSDINSHLPCVGGGIKKCLECGTDAAVCAAQTAESNLVAALRITLRVLEVHVPHRLLHCLAFPAHLSVHPLVFP